MIYYEDLLTVPYKTNGRSMDGMDCYGLVLECSRRNETPLNDILKPGETQVNAVKIETPEAGDIATFFEKGHFHIVFYLAKDTVIHMTRYGVRVSCALDVERKNNYMAMRIEKNDSSIL